MDRKLLLSALTATLAAGAAGAQNDRRPNVIILMTDQQRADLCAREGYALDVVPFADRMAAQGVWFDRAYTTAPLSVPARTSLLTGRFATATHVRTNENTADAFFAEDMPALFRAEGYRTAMVGKNHTYAAPADFDYWTSYSHWGKDRKDIPRAAELADYLRTNRSWSLDATPLPVEAQNPWQIVTQALEWITDPAQRDRPFFAWVSFPEPHNPYQVSEPYYSMFPPEEIPAFAGRAEHVARKGAPYEALYALERAGGVNDPAHLARLQANYLGMLRLVDDQMARLVEGLKASGQYDNTIFVILSDHGDYVGEYGLMKKGAGMSDALTRIPMVWFGRGIVCRGLHEAHVSLMDVFPTLCEAIGAAIPAGVQGRSLWPMLTGRPYPAAEFSSILCEQGYGGALYTLDDELTFLDEPCLHPDKPGEVNELNSWTMSGARRMVRKGDWKLVVDNYGHAELYNVRRDPSELENLFGRRRYAAVQADLQLALAAWMIRAQDPLPLPRHRLRFKTEPHNYLHAE